MMRLFQFIDYNIERLIRNWRQKRAYEWAVAAGFVMTKEERGMRVLEEALELAQAAGVTKDQARTLVAYTFSRPAGEIRQEIGGVTQTLMCFAATQGLSVCTEERREFQRCLARDPEEIKAKHKAKIEAGIAA